MSTVNEPQWLVWARALQAHAQDGLAYCKDPYDIERFNAIQEIAAEIMATYGKADLQQVLDLFKEQSGYATPKVDVRAVVFRGDALLLVREKSDGLWTLPGGWADVGESPGEAVARETLEESGFQVRASKLLAVYDRNRHGHPPLPFYVYKLFFRCDLLGGVPTEGQETDAVGFFREGEIPELSQTRVTPAEVKRLFEHHRHSNWPTDFD